MKDHTENKKVVIQDIYTIFREFKYFSTLLMLLGGFCVFCLITHYIDLPLANKTEVVKMDWFRQYWYLSHTNPVKPNDENNLKIGLEGMHEQYFNERW